MRTIDLTRFYGLVVGLELMAAITGKDDIVTVLCRTSDQASLVTGAINRARKSGKTNVTAEVKVKE